MYENRFIFHSPVTIRLVKYLEELPVVDYKCSHFHEHGNWLFDEELFHKAKFIGVLIYGALSGIKF